MGKGKKQEKEGRPTGRIMARGGYAMLRSSAMSEVPAAGRQRWFHLRFPEDCRATHVWAEKFFDRQSEAFDYYEHRRAEHPTGRVHPPIASAEDESIWAVCVDPV